MGFQQGNKLGTSSKRGTAKVDKELKAFLEVLTTEALQSIDITKLSNSDKIKLISTGLNYVLPKLQSTDITANVNTTDVSWLESWSEKDLEKILNA